MRISVPVAGLLLCALALPALGAPSLAPADDPLFTPRHAEEVGREPPVTLPLARVYALASTYSRVLHIDRLAITRADKNLQAARASCWPTLSLSAGLTRQLGAANAANTDTNAGFNGDPSTNLTGQLGLSYPLFTGFARPARVHVAELQLEEARLTYRQAALQLQLDLATSYYDIQLADEQLRLAREIADDADAALRSGRGLPRFDTVRLTLQRAHYRQLQRTFEAQARVARARLVRQLDLGDAADVAVETPPAEVAAWVLSREQSLLQAYERRPELASQLVQLHIAEEQRTIALSAYWPQLGLNANTNLLKHLEDGTGQKGTAAGLGYAYGATLNETLFDGFGAWAQAQAAEASMAIAKETYADTRAQVRQDVEGATANFEAGAASLRLAAGTATLGREALRLAGARLGPGAGVRDLLDAQNDLYRARNNELNAVLGYDRAVAALAHATGTLAGPLDAVP